MKNVYIKTMLLSLVVSVSIRAGASLIDAGIQAEAFNALVIENQALKDGLNVAKEGLSAASKEFDILYAQSTLGTLLKNTGESIKSVSSCVVDAAKTAGSNAVDVTKTMSSNAIELIKTTGSNVVESIKLGTNDFDIIKNNERVRVGGLFACAFIGAGSGFYLGNKIFGNKIEQKQGKHLLSNDAKIILCGLAGEILGMAAWFKFLEAMGATK